MQKLTWIPELTWQRQGFDATVARCFFCSCSLKNGYPVVLDSHLLCLELDGNSLRVGINSALGHTPELHYAVALNQNHLLPLCPLPLDFLCIYAYIYQESSRYLAVYTTPAPRQTLCCCLAQMFSRKNCLLAFNITENNFDNESYIPTNFNDFCHWGNKNNGKHENGICAGTGEEFM